VNQDVLDKSKGGSTRVAFLVGSVSRGQAKRRIYKWTQKAFQSSVFDRYLQRADLGVSELTKMSPTPVSFNQRYKEITHDHLLFSVA
jgi:hypothetical protein